MTRNENRSRLLIAGTLSIANLALVGSLALAGLSGDATGVTGVRPMASNTQYPALKPAASHSTPAATAGQGRRVAEALAWPSPG